MVVHNFLRNQFSKGLERCIKSSCVILDIPSSTQLASSLHVPLPRTALFSQEATNHPLTITMRFAAIIAALAVTATALPATSLEQTGASLGT